MPDLDTSLHLDRLRRYRRQNSLRSRLRRAVKLIVSPADLYGLQWGDPDEVAPLRYVRETYIEPYVRPDQVAVEIGPGGGRWTRYLTGFGKLYAIDCHQELLDELGKNFRRSNIVPVKSSGTDFPGISEGSVDYIFSFGVFVHLDSEVIKSYLKNMKYILATDSNVVIQYSDKSKIMARKISTFSDNDPVRMRNMLKTHGYSILEEDTTTLWHSSIVRFTI